MVAHLPEAFALFPHSIVLRDDPEKSLPPPIGEMPRPPRPSNERSRPWPLGISCFPWPFWGGPGQHRPATTWSTTSATEPPAGFKACWHRSGFVSSVLSSTALSVYCLLIVRYGWADPKSDQNRTLCAGNDFGSWHRCWGSIPFSSICFTATTMLVGCRHHPTTTATNPDPAEGEECIIEEASLYAHILILAFLPVLLPRYRSWHHGVFGLQGTQKRKTNSASMLPAVPFPPPAIFSVRGSRVGRLGSASSGAASAGMAGSDDDDGDAVEDDVPAVRGPAERASSDQFNELRGDGSSLLPLAQINGFHCGTHRVTQENPKAVVQTGWLLCLGVPVDVRVSIGCQHTLRCCGRRQRRFRCLCLLPLFAIGGDV